MATWSVKSSGGDFTTLQAAHDSGSVSADDIVEAQEDFACQTSAALTTSKRLTFRAATANKVTTPSNSQATSKARIDVNGDSAVNNGVDGTIVEGFGVVGDSYANSAFFSNGFSGTFRRCVVINFSSGYFIGGTATGVIQNNAFIECRGRVGRGFNGGSTTYLHHNSAFCSASGAQGIEQVNGPTNTYANIVFHAGGDDYLFGSFFNDGAYNVAEDATADDIPGTSTHYLNSQTPSDWFENTSSGTEDLSIKSGKQQSFGVPDYSGSYADLATSLNGESRSGVTRDPGCWQTPAAGGATSRVAMCCLV